MGLTTKKSTANKLSNEAIEYRIQVLAELGKENDISKLDLLTIEILVNEVDKYYKVDKLLKSQDIVTTNKYSGAYSKHPGVDIQKAAISSISTLWNALGLTPESRLKFAKVKGTLTKNDTGKKKNAGVLGQSVVKN